MFTIFIFITIYYHPLAVAQIPAGYYNSAQGLTGQAFKNCIP
jgi:hypothetical protein